MGRPPPKSHKTVCNPVSPIHSHCLLVKPGNDYNDADQSQPNPVSFLRPLVGCSFPPFISVLLQLLGVIL